MKSKYFIIALLAFSIGIISTKAMTIGDCDVLASYKQNSSLDDNTYICKNKEFGTPSGSIYYSGKEDTIKLDNFNAYYFAIYKNVTLDIKNMNNISLLHTDLNKIKVTGSGELRFKESSYVKKVLNGEAVYYYTYKNKVLIDSNNKAYELTLKEFENNYEQIKLDNKIDLEFDITNFTYTQVTDYQLLTPVPVTTEWLNNYIITDLAKKIEDGTGLIKKEEEPKKDEKTLETEQVVFTSSENLNQNYKLEVNDIKEQEVGKQVEKEIVEAKQVQQTPTEKVTTEKQLVSLYDVNVTNNNKKVKMKNGKYTLKLKLPEDAGSYDTYQVIYVSDNGEVKEYIDGYVENGYVVFETTHLSQYGIVGTKSTVEKVSPSKTTSEKTGFIVKLTIPISFIIFSLGLLLFVYKKADFKKTKHKK